MRSGMGRVGIPTKYIFLRGLARGDGCGLWSTRRGCGINKKIRKTERGGQEMYTNIRYIGESPTRPASSARVVVDVDVHIFNTKTKLKGV